MLKSWQKQAKKIRPYGPNCINLLLVVGIVFRQYNPLFCSKTCRQEKGEGQSQPLDH